MLYHHIIEFQSLKKGLNDVIFLPHLKVTVEIVSVNQTDYNLKFNLLVKCINIISVILKSVFWMKIDCDFIFIEGVPPVQQSLTEV